MHYFRVPKLGAYLAVKLEYGACELDYALDVAIVDYQEVKQKKKEQEEEKKLYYEKLEDERIQREEEGAEEVVIEERIWEKIENRPFEEVKVSLVVCLNTMGQDRPFSEEETKEVLRRVREYRDKWEMGQKQNLQRDVIRRIENAVFDRNYREMSYELSD